MGKELYTKEDMEKIFQNGVSRGLCLYGMIMNHQSSEKHIKILGTIFPDFEGAIKKIETNKR